MLPSHKIGPAQKAISSPEVNYQISKGNNEWSGSRNINEYQPHNSTLLEEKIIERYILKHIQKRKTSPGKKIFGH